MDPLERGTTAGTPRLAWALHGAEGPPVLMVMGFGMAGVMWRNQIEGLRDRHRVATFDHRGIGDSDDDRRWYRMEDLADDALRVADALGWSTFHLVGVSMGGMVAQHVALKAPDRLRSLVLMVTQPGGPFAWLPPRTGLRTIAGLPRHRTAAARARALGGLLYTADAPDTVPAERMAQRARDMAAHAPARPTVLRQLHAVVRHRTHDRLHAIRTPTLVVQAARDNLIDPRHSATLARRIPDARWLRIGPAAHGLIVEANDTVNAAIADHVGRHEPHQVS